MLNQNKKMKYLFPLLHFIASFFYDRTEFIYQKDIQVIAAIPRIDWYTDKMEWTVSYFFTKFFAAIAIFLVWRLIFYVVEHWKEDLTVKIFVPIFLVGLVGVLFLHQRYFFVDWDNQITYSYAIRFAPEYWHSAYTGFLYGACLNVFPHVFTLGVMQWLAFVFDIGYLFQRIRHIDRLKKYSWLVFLIAFMPNVMNLFMDPYRTEIYALLCMFAAEVILMDWLEGKKRGKKDIIKLIWLFAFLSVWRTEGLILGFTAVIVMLLWIYQVPFRKFVLYFVGLLFAFILILLPQKLGDIKYYGNDYSFINSFPSLENILNSQEANLSYEGVEEDLAAIEKICPINVIRSYGMDGYRRYNVLNGRKDINQSLASDADGKAYKKAFRRIALHNVPIYLKTQLNFLGTIMKVNCWAYHEPNAGISADELPAWEYDAWAIGNLDYAKYTGAINWYYHPFKVKVESIYLNILGRASDILERFYYTAIRLGILFVLQIVMILAELIKGLLKRKWPPAVSMLSCGLLLQGVAIFLVMPAGTLSYFRAYLVCTFLADMIYILYLIQNRKSSQQREEI